MLSQKKLVKIISLWFFILAITNILIINGKTFNDSFTSINKRSDQEQKVPKRIARTLTEDIQRIIRKKNELEAATSSRRFNLKYIKDNHKATIREKIRSNPIFQIKGLIIRSIENITLNSATVEIEIPIISYSRRITVDFWIWNDSSTTNVVSSFDLATIKNNDYATLKAQIEGNFNFRNHYSNFSVVSINNITINSAYAIIKSSSLASYITIFVRFYTTSYTISSIIRSILDLEETTSNNHNRSEINLGYIEVLQQPTFIHIIDCLIERLRTVTRTANVNIVINSDYIIGNDVNISFEDPQTTLKIEKDTLEENFSFRLRYINFISDINRYAKQFDLGEIENETPISITEMFFNLNPLLGNNRERVPLLDYGVIKLRSAKPNKEYDFKKMKIKYFDYTNCKNKKAKGKEKSFTVYFKIKKKNKITNNDSYSVGKNDKNYKKPPDDEPDSGSANSKIIKYHRSKFYLENPTTSSTNYNIKEYNIGQIKNNQKKTIIESFIDNVDIRWNHPKPSAAAFNFIDINPTTAKLAVIKPIAFVFKDRSITLKANEIFNLSFNITDQITVSSIIRMLSAKNFVLPLFMWTNTYKILNEDTIKNERKNAIIDQIFSWLQYLKLEKVQLPESLYHLTTDEQILYDDENITITDIKLPENEFGEVNTILKIRDEGKEILLRFNEYDIRIFFNGNTIDSIETEDAASNILKVLHIYFKNLQLQIDQFVDHINKQARAVVNLGSILDKSDIHILNALVQYAENHKITSSAKIRKLIFKIWAEQTYLNPNIFITANNNKGKIVFPGNKIINVSFTMLVSEITKPVPTSASILTKKSFFQGYKKKFVATAGTLVGSTAILYGVNTTTAVTVATVGEGTSLLAAEGAGALTLAPETFGLSLVVGGFAIVGTSLWYAFK